MEGLTVESADAERVALPVPGSRVGGVACVVGGALPRSGGGMPLRAVGRGERPVDSRAVR